MCCSVSLNVGQTAELLGRIVGSNGNPLVQADITSIAYSAYILEIATGEENEVEDFQAIDLPVVDHLEDSLQLNVKWDTDAEGYNFHFIPSPEIFAERGETYLIRATFEPVDTDLPSLVGVWLIDVV